MSINEDPKFRIVVKGQPETVFDPEIINRLASRLSATPKQIEQIVRSPHYVLAKGLNEARAATYRQILAGCGIEVLVEDESELLSVELPGNVLNQPAPVDGGEATIRRLADYQKASGVLWIVLAVIQVLTIYVILAGIWKFAVGM